MFTDFKLVPGGAIMMCESVAEFDPNVNTMAPEAPGVTEEQNVAAANAAVKAELDIHLAYCPVAAVATKLGPLYDEVHALLTNKLTFDDREDMVRQLECISDLATKVANTLRMCLVKTDALYRYVDRTDYYTEPVREYGGFFLRNSTKLLQDGYDSISVTMDWLQELTLYSVRDRISTNMKLDDLLPMAPSDVLNTINWCRDPVRFSSTIDFMDTFFHNPERMARLLKPETRTFEISRMLRDCGESDCRISEGHSGFITGLVTWMATVLKAIKTKCYEMQCELTDPGCRLDMGNSAHLSKLHSAVVNLFCFPAIYIIAESYEIKAGLASYQAVKDGVDEILTHYGVKPGK